MNKKDLHKLDEIGFIGSQQKVSSFVKKRDIKKTGEFIKAYKAAQSKSASSGSKVKKAS